MRPVIGDEMQDLVDKYKDSGMRLTHQRKVILGVIAEADDHPDVDTLYRRASAIYSLISLATVYRTVGALEQAGIIEKLDIGDGKARYEIAGQHHDHLIDMDSGEIYEFHDAELEKMKVEIAKRMGFSLVGHRLELFARRLVES